MTDLAHYLANHPTVFLTAAGVLGLAFGSFLNVVIHRLPIMLERGWREQCRQLLAQTNAASTATHTTSGAADSPARFNLVVPGSRCPHCGHRIRAWENVPVFSFLLLRGRCSNCAAKISWRYPAVELLTGVLTAVVAWRFGFTATAAAALGLTFALIALTFIDYDHQLLPDDITLPLLWAGLFVNIFSLFVPLASAVIGAISGYLSLWLVYHAFKLLTGKEGMGFGDFKLFAAFGAWLGWQSLPFIILFASLLGAVVGLVVILLLGRDRNLPIPFGPFLCAAAFVSLLWGETISRAWLKYARLY